MLGSLFTRRGPFKYCLEYHEPAGVCDGVTVYHPDLKREFFEAADDFAAKSHIMHFDNEKFAELKMRIEIVSLWKQLESWLTRKDIEYMSDLVKSLSVTRGGAGE